jgi:hypothetical protein
MLGELLDDLTAPWLPLTTFVFQLLAFPSNLS